MTRTILALALAAMLPSAAFASTADLATIESECGTQLNLSAGDCTCIRDLAAKLSDGQQAFVAAVVTKNKVAQQQIMQAMTVAELTEAGMFMTSAPATCGKGG